MKLILFIGILLLFAGCITGHDTAPIDPNAFAVYLLADSQLTTHQLDPATLNEFEIKSEAFFNLNDIIAFKWEEQELTLSIEASERIRWISQNRITVFGIPLVFVARNERIYLGSFWFAHSSIAPQVPYLGLLLPGSKSDTVVLKIEKAWDPNLSDPRFDDRIYNAVKAAGVLAE